MINRASLARLIPAFVLFSALTGCASQPAGEIEPPADSSWALKASYHTRINPDGNLFDDALSDPAEHVKNIRSGKSGLGSVALAGGYAMAPKGGSSALNSLVLLDILAGGNDPVFPYHHRTALAWFPVELASSREEARDKFHALRVSNVERALKEIGAEYTVKEIDLKRYLLAGDWKRQTELRVQNDAGKMCNKCVFGIVTNLPDKETVMAPAFITGRSYEAYQFNGSLKEGSERDTRSWTLMVAKEFPDDENRSHLYWHTRNYEQLLWMNKHNPDWQVDFIQAYQRSQFRNLTDEDISRANTFPFMVHKGEIKHFVKGAK